MNHPAEKPDFMGAVEECARTYARVRLELAEAAAKAELELQAVREKHAENLRNLLSLAAHRQADLEVMIDANRELFDKPRTRTVDGIKFGLRKLAGTVEIKDEARTIERIRELLPEEQGELLIRIRESVDRNAVKDLQVRDLKRLGIEIGQDTDVPVVKAVDKDIDKQIAAATRDLEVKT